MCNEKICWTKVAISTNLAGLVTPPFPFLGTLQAPHAAPQNFKGGPLGLRAGHFIVDSSIGPFSSHAFRHSGGQGATFPKISTEPPQTIFDPKNKKIPVPKLCLVGEGVPILGFGLRVG